MTPTDNRLLLGRISVCLLSFRKQKRSFVLAFSGIDAVVW